MSLKPALSIQPEELIDKTTHMRASGCAAVRGSIRGIPRVAEQVADSAIGQATEEDRDNRCGTQYQQDHRSARFWIPRVERESRSEHYRQSGHHRRNVRGYPSQPTCLDSVHSPGRYPLAGRDRELAEQRLCVVQPSSGTHMPLCRRTCGPCGSSLLLAMVGLPFGRTVPGTRRPSLDVVGRASVHAMSEQTLCCCACTSPRVVHLSADACSAPDDAIARLGSS
jgi:hypothetical protein